MAGKGYTFRDGDWPRLRQIIQKLTIDDLAVTMLGTTNQVTVTDNGDGTLTFSLPQDIDTAADVQFGSAVITNTATVGRILAGGVTT